MKVGESGVQNSAQGLEGQSDGSSDISISLVRLDSWVKPC